MWKRRARPNPQSTLTLLIRFNAISGQIYCLWCRVAVSRCFGLVSDTNNEGEKKRHAPDAHGMRRWWYSKRSYIFAKNRQDDTRQQ